MNTNSLAASRRRREEIARLVGERLVRSQDELSGLLRARGWRVAQPTLSRDVRALGLAKTAAGYVLPGGGAPAAPGAREAELDRALAEHARSVVAAGSLVIVKTPPAGAHPLARALDEAGLPGVAGTIAGDDTVFVATSAPGAARRVAARLQAPLASRQPLRRRA